MKKNKNSLFLTFFIIFPLLVILVFFWWKWATGAPQPNAQGIQATFVIYKDESLSEIIDRLAQENLVKSPLAFKILLKKEGWEGKMQAGDFRLSPAMNARELALELQHGTLDTWVTVTEGLRLEEVYTVFADAGFGLNYDEWLTQTKSKEGYLFPETYLIPKEATAGGIVEIMTETFKEKTADLADMDEETIVLASLVEKEARGLGDKRIVAGILSKRLEAGWPLEVDASAKYAVNSDSCDPKTMNGSQLSKCWWVNVTGQDLDIDSEFNTYKNVGLPPSPICNPGLETIKAVLEPKDSDYWFYLSDASGNMHWAKTLEEHEQNIAKYLK